MSGHYFKFYCTNMEDKLTVILLKISLLAFFLNYEQILKQFLINVSLYNIFI